MAAQVATSPGSNDLLDLQIQGLNTHDSDDNSKDDDDSSVDTQDAFLDMLGLPTVEALNSVLVMDEEEEEEHTATAAVGSTTTSTKEGTATTVARNIELPPKCSRHGHAPSQCAAVVVAHFWSEPECQALIQMAHSRKFQYITEATHTSPDGSKYKVQLSNPNPHKLAVFEDSGIIDRMWTKLIEHPATNLLQSEWLLQYQQRCLMENKHIQPVGLNPRIRVLEYDAKDGDRFEPHFDATTHVGPHTSHITVLLYLNDGNGVDFEGGETLYLDSHISKYNTTTANNNNHHDSSKKQDHNVVKIIPQTGKLVMFEHDLYHAGAPLHWGTKYVMRTDILFETIATEETSTASNEQQRTTTTTTGGNENYDNKDEIISNITAAKCTDSDSSTTAVKKPLLVMDLCQALEWASDDQAILDDMGLLQCTLESFLLPGSKLLQTMLADGGLDKLRVQELIQAAIFEEKQQKQQLSSS